MRLASGLWPRDLRALFAIFKKELVDLLRDRRVLFAAVLLPALLFPVLIAISGRVTESGNEKLGTREIRVGVVGSSQSLEALLRRTTHASWASGGKEEDIRSGELDALLLAGRNAEGRSRLTILYDASRENSRIAKGRLETALEEQAHEDRLDAITGKGVSTAFLEARELDYLDLAGARMQGRLAELLPTLLILVLLSSSAFAALDLFPGERERGTLETLMVQPVGMLELVLAKYFAIVCIGLIAVGTNLLGSFLGSALLLDPEGSGIFEADAVPKILAIAIPIALLLTAILVRVVAAARSVREAQTWLMPLMLLCLLPPFLASSPHVPFDSFTACIPLGGAALAFREASVGSYPILPLLFMLLSTLLFTAWILKSSIPRLLEDGGLLGDQGGQQRSTQRFRATLVAAGSILTVYGLSPFLAEESAFVRLAVPLAIGVFAPAVLFARFVGIDMKRVVFARGPTKMQAFHGLRVGIALALLATAIGDLQQGVLPTPARFVEASRELLGDAKFSPLSSVLLFAILPALAEELLYRGLFLRAYLSGQASRSRAILATSILFALHHLSIFRFLPSLAAGLVLAGLALSTGSVWPAILAHASSNALLVLCGPEQAPLHGTALAGFLANPSLAGLRLGLALGILLLPRLANVRRRRPIAV